MRSGRRDSNPRLSPWKGDALPLSYSRIPSWGMWGVVFRIKFISPFTLPIPNSNRWAGEDSNLRRHKPADLQSAAFGHFATDPAKASGPARPGWLVYADLLHDSRGRKVARMGVEFQMKRSPFSEESRPTFRKISTKVVGLFELRFRGVVREFDGASPPPCLAPSRE